MDFSCIAGPVVLAGVYLTPPLTMRSEDGDVQSMSLQWENDTFIGSNDKNYTNGVRFGWAMKKGKKPPFFGKAVKMLFPKDAKGDDELLYSLFLGQNMYTPSDISIVTPQPNDRPYAGWTYMGGGITLKKGRSFHAMEVDIGIIGPASGAGKAQRWWHDCRNLQTPRGWQNQIGNEPGLIVSYEVGKSSKITKMPFGLQGDVTGSAGVSLGNVYTHLKGGAIFRLGSNLTRDYSAPTRIRPSIPGSDIHLGTGMDFTLFTGFEARVVGWNTFLDGSLFDSSSPSVDSKTLVSDFIVGATWYINSIRLSYTHTFRSQEFVGAIGSNNFGSLNLSWRF